MRIFKGFNEHTTCLVCGTNEDKPCVLVGIIGTEDGGNMEAKAVHVDCLELYYYPTSMIIAQRVEPKEEHD